jgi:hypothetical protein
MKKDPTVPPFHPEPSEDDIRAYAFHLYQQGGEVPGHDVENWLEATACLKAQIPTHGSRVRLHLYINGTEYGIPQTERFFLRGENPLFLSAALDDPR